VSASGKGLEGLWTELGDTYVLGLVRVAFGGMIFWEALGLARDLSSEGYFGDVFHLPFIPETWVASRLLYTGLLASMLVLAVLATVGHRARLALGASAAIGLYVLLCDRLQFHHNRYALFCLAGLLSLSPCDRSFLITGSVETPAARIGSLWVTRLARAQVSLIYVASGGGKLLDADWRNGIVLGDRIARHASQAIAQGVPARVVEWLAGPMASSALAKVAIATELFLAFGLWPKRTRIYALWWGVVFHLTIEATSRVELFTWLMLASYALFVTPDVQARKLFFDPSRAKGAVYSRLVRLFDWFARFDVVAWEPDGIRTGHSLVIVRRDGTRATGIRAFAMAARCLPILFPLWGPVALVASFTKGGEASARA
jgi:Vitamin K-dependent gamma-carboxylase